MEFEQQKTVITLRVRDAEPVRSKYLTVPVAPEDVAFTFFDDGETWAKVAGYKLKKDGQPGQVWAVAVFRQYPWPEWLRDLAQKVRPTTFPVKESK